MTNERALPQSREAEESVVGAVLVHPEVLDRVKPVLEPSDFFFETLGAIYRTVLSLHESGDAIDPAVVSEALPEAKATVYELYASVPATANVRRHAEIVKAHAVRREKLYACQRCIEALYAHDDDALALEAEAIARPIVTGVSSHHYVDFETATHELISYLDDPDSAPLGLGIPELDAAMRGILRGQVVLVAARPGIGKTQLLNTLIDSFVRTNPKDGLLFLSLEMSPAEIAERQLAIALNCFPEDIENLIRMGKLREFAGDFIDKSRNVVQFSQPVHVKTLDGVVAVGKEELRKRGFPLRLLIIDYAQLVSGRGQAAYERATDAARAIKSVTMSHNISTIAAAQLSRAAGDGHLPVDLSNIRDSGQWEQDAHCVVGLWQPGLDPSLNPMESISLMNTVRAKLLKARRGKPGMVVDLVFDKTRALRSPANQQEGTWGQ